MSIQLKSFSQNHLMTFKFKKKFTGKLAKFCVVAVLSVNSLVSMFIFEIIIYMQHFSLLSPFIVLPYITFHSPSKSWSLFVTNCNCVCVHTRISISKNNILSHYNASRVCVFSRLTIWHWTTSWYAPPW